MNKSLHLDKSLGGADHSANHISINISTQTANDSHENSKLTEGRRSRYDQKSPPTRSLESSVSKRVVKTVEGSPSKSQSPVRNTRQSLSNSFLGTQYDDFGYLEERFNEVLSHAHMIGSLGKSDLSTMNHKNSIKRLVSTWKQDNHNKNVHELQVDVERLELEAKEKEAEVVMLRIVVDDLIKIANGFRKHAHRSQLG